MMTSASQDKGSALPRTVPAVIMRGGTSKGVFVHARDLPPAGSERDTVVLDLMGSPDPMQIDGLGGTHSSTSKLVTVAPSERPDADVEYWFAQVGVEQPIVDWSGNCGNLTTAVGPFAVDEGLVPAQEPTTTVRLRNGNTGVRIDAHVPVCNGRAVYAGPHAIAGVPTPGAPIVTEYLEPGGSVCRSELPTGAPIDVLTAVVNGDDEEYAVSIVDVTHPYAVVRADAVGLRLDLSPTMLNGDGELLDRLEAIRGACAVRLGVIDTAAEATERAPSIPRLAIVSAPGDETAELIVRVVSMGRVHHALPMTAALCLAAAARIPDTIPHTVARPAAGGERVRIAHPKGVADAHADVESSADGSYVRTVSVVRTARRLMSGTAFAREVS